GGRLLRGQECSARGIGPLLRSRRLGVDRFGCATGCRAALGKTVVDGDAGRRDDMHHISGAHSHYAALLHLAGLEDNGLRTHVTANLFEALLQCNSFVLFELHAAISIGLSAAFAATCAPSTMRTSMPGTISL